MKIRISNIPGNDAYVIEAGNNRVTFQSNIALSENTYLNMYDLTRLKFPFEFPFTAIFEVGSESPWRSFVEYEFKVKDDDISMRGIMRIKGKNNITAYVSGLSIIDLTEDFLRSLALGAKKFYDQAYTRSIISNLNNEIAIKLISSGHIPIGNILMPCCIVTDSEDIVNVSNEMTFISTSKKVFCVLQKNGAYTKLPLEIKEHCRLMLAAGNKALLIPAALANMSNNEITVAVNIPNGTVVQISSISKKLRTAIAGIKTGTVKPDISEDDAMPEQYNEEYAFYKSLL